MLAAPGASDRLTGSVPTRPEYWMATPTAALERVIDDPVLDGAALSHRRHDPAEHPLAHGAILPTGFADEMLDRLGAARDVPAFQALGDRLHALALTGQQQCSRSAHAGAHRCPQPRPDPRDSPGSAAPSRHRNSVLRSCH